ncbi:MAG: DUF2064 domain-containing protein [Planctomycetes bacterium]|jgi:hypothetical protein|nr:DUF2064 domain-containing protein [Planctomycetota bacterium]MCL4730791.1 DUF2064 domain-containing protein [Planctomycetota bacterium]
MNQTRVPAWIVSRPPFAPAAGGAELAGALREDLRELCHALRLRLNPEPADVAALGARAGQGLLLLFSDVPAVPPPALEAALDAVAEADLALGPCADGALYLLALRPGLEPDVAAEVLAHAASPDAVARLTDLCDDANLAAVVLPPWFRLARQSDLSFAESLARLSLMTEEGEEGFVADRLRLWFEQHAMDESES